MRTIKNLSPFYSDYSGDLPTYSVAVGDPDNIGERAVSLAGSTLLLGYIRPVESTQGIRGAVVVDWEWESTNGECGFYENQREACRALLRPLARMLADASLDEKTP